MILALKRRYESVAITCCWYHLLIASRPQVPADPVTVRLDGRVVATGGARRRSAPCRCHCPFPCTTASPLGGAPPERRFRYARFGSDMLVSAQQSNNIVDQRLHPAGRAPLPVLAMGDGIRTAASGIAANRTAFALHGRPKSLRAQRGLQPDC